MRTARETDLPVSVAVGICALCPVTLGRLGRLGRLSLGPGLFDHLRLVVASGDLSLFVVRHAGR